MIWMPCAGSPPETRSRCSARGSAHGEQYPFFQVLPDHADLRETCLHERSLVEREPCGLVCRPVRPEQSPLGERVGELRLGAYGVPPLSPAVDVTGQGCVLAAAVDLGGGRPDPAQAGGQRVVS